MDMIAFCGLNCSRCPAHVATVENDAEKALTVAKMWSHQFGINVLIEDIWCDGCLAGGKKCAHCHQCEIRACAMEKGVQTCAHCPDYACEKILAFFKLAPEAKKNLDEIKGKL